MDSIVKQLLASGEPAIRYQVRVHVLGDDPRSTRIRKLGAEVAASARVKALLSERRANGEIPFPPYAKWYGAHWVLVTLADLDYPPRDKSLIPLRDQVLDWLFSPDYVRLIRRVKGITRIHASIDANAIYAPTN